MQARHLPSFIQIHIVVGLLHCILNVQCKLQNSTINRIFSTDWVDIAKQKHRASNQSQYQQHQSTPQTYFLRHCYLRPQLLLSVTLLNTFWQVHVGLNLCKLQPLEDVQCCFREGPVYYTPEFKQERYVVPGLEDGLTHCVVLVNHKASFSQFWHSHLELVRLEYEIKHEQSVENNQRWVVFEFVAKGSVIYISTVFLLVSHWEKYIPVHQNQYQPIVVHLDDSLPWIFSDHGCKRFLVGFHFQNFFFFI